MGEVYESNGRVWAIEYGAGCDDCFGLGAVFEHLPSCDSDFCVGNGDEHACSGAWLPCDTCGSMNEIRATPHPSTSSSERRGEE